MFLGDGDGGEGLDLLFVCRRGARVFKLIEELKDKSQSAGSLAGRRGPSPRAALKRKPGLPAKAPRLRSPGSLDTSLSLPAAEAEPPHAYPLFCLSSRGPLAPGVEAPTPHPLVGQTRPESWAQLWPSSPPVQQLKATEVAAFPPR